MSNSFFEIISMLISVQPSCCKPKPFGAISFQDLHTFYPTKVGVFLACIIGIKCITVPQLVKETKPREKAQLMNGNYKPYIIHKRPTKTYFQSESMCVVQNNNHQHITLWSICFCRVHSEFGMLKIYVGLTLDA